MGATCSQLGPRISWIPGYRSQTDRPAVSQVVNHVLIDSHCHLASLADRGVLEAALRNAREAGVEQIIAIGTSAGDWTVNRDLCAGNAGTIAYTVGLHPTDIGDDWEEQLEQIGSFFAEDPAPVAIGEIGLDHFHLPKYPDEAAEMKVRQVEVFSYQLALAVQFDCPVVVHSRNAFFECLKVIEKSGFDWERVVFHCFVEGPQEIRGLNERGGRGSFTGLITYNNASRIREAALEQDLDRIMVETDAPYLSPEPVRGRMNEPAHVRHTADFCAGLFDMKLEDFAEVSTRNTVSFFGL